MTIDEMRKELEAAGYQFLAEHSECMSFDDFTGWVQAPDGTWIEGQSFSYKMRSDWEDAKKKADDSCIEKAYAHMKEKRKQAELEAFVKKVYDAIQEGHKDAIRNNPQLIGTQVMSVAIVFDSEDVREIKRLLGKE